MAEWQCANSGSCPLRTLLRPLETPSPSKGFSKTPSLTRAKRVNEAARAQIRCLLGWRSLPTGESGSLAFCSCVFEARAFVTRLLCLARPLVCPLPAGSLRPRSGARPRSTSTPAGTLLRRSPSRSSRRVTATRSSRAPTPPQQRRPSSPRLSSHRASPLRPLPPLPSTQRTPTLTLVRRLLAVAWAWVASRIPTPPRLYRWTSPPHQVTPRRRLS